MSESNAKKWRVKVVSREIVKLRKELKEWKEKYEHAQKEQWITQLILKDEMIKHLKKELKLYKDIYKNTFEYVKFYMNPDCWDNFNIDLAFQMLCLHKWKKSKNKKLICKICNSEKDDNE